MTSTKLAVITSENVKTQITLVPAGTLKSRLGKMSKDSITNTLALAYYTTANGNINPLGNCLQNIASLLNPIYRQFVSAKFDEETQKWVFHTARSKKLMNELGLTYQKCTFEEFAAAIEANVKTKKAKLDKALADKDALSDVEVMEKTKSTIVSYLTKHCSTFTEVQMQDMLIQARRAADKATA